MRQVGFVCMKGISVAREYYSQKTGWIILLYEIYLRKNVN